MSITWFREWLWRQNGTSAKRSQRRLVDSLRARNRRQFVRQLWTLETLEDRRLLVASLAINDVSIAEGNSGTSSLVFTVTRSGDDSLSNISVGYATANSTATAGSDYTVRSGTVTIPSGATTATISVPVLGDTTLESNEQFFVNLTGVTNATGPAPTFNTKNDFATGTSPSQVAVGDFNGDGKPDLVIANRTTNNVSVLFNTTSPGATVPTYATKVDFATGTKPYSVTIGDINGDGKPDVITANADTNNVSVLLNKTSSGATAPTFTTKSDFPTGSHPTFVAIGDLNGDGKLDLAVTNIATGVSILLNTTTAGGATATFTAKTDITTGASPYSVAIGDLNGDGKLDLATANLNDGSVSVLLNTTTIGSTTPTYAPKTDFTLGGSANSVAIGDLNGDGKLDLVVTNAGLDNASVLLGTTATGAATATFAAKTDLVTAFSPWSVTLADFNRDGKLDVVIANNNSTGSVSIFSNQTVPGENFVRFATKTDFTTGAYSNSVATGDFNGDGKLDLVVSNGGTGSVSVLLNTTLFSAATISTVKTDFLTGQCPAAVAVGDLNGDGKPDLAIANTCSDSVSILFNTTAPGQTFATYAPKQDVTTGFTPRGVSIGDLNGDGKPDLVTANRQANTVSILSNTTTPGASAPTFTAKSDITVGTLPYSVAIGDLNGVGKPDLAIANYSSNSISILLNATTSGTTIASFVANTVLTTGSKPSSVTIGDLNGDGKLDIAAANINSSTVSVFRNTTSAGSATLSFDTKSDVTTASRPDSVAVGDLNGDGKLDLVSSNLNANSVSVLLNTTTVGATTLSFAAKSDFTVGSSPRSVAIKDLNGDGKLDIATANQTTNNLSILRNTTTAGAATATFSTKADFATGDAPFSVAIGDLNGDGKPDLATANYGSIIVSVLLNSLPTISDNQGIGTILNDDTQNLPPTTVTLSPSSASLAENVSTASAIVLASISIADDGFGTNLLSLSGADAAHFEIVGSDLRLKVGISLDFETKTCYAVRVNVDDATVGSTPNAFVDFVLSITNVNEAPTSLTLSPTSISENNLAGTVIGTFSSLDPDASDTFTYSLVTGTGSTDNTSFSIVGNLLKANSSFDFETKSSYSIRIRTTDAPGLTFDKLFTISVTDVEEVPPTVASTSLLASGTLPVGTTSLAVTFSEPVVGSNVTANYELRGAGADGLLLNADTVITPTSVTVSGNTATLNFASPFAEDVYRLTVKDTITDIAGNRLDGDANGTATGNWRRDFVVGTVSTTLNSPAPNSSPFDIEYGGFGAGQLVQGRSGAFDGLNRLQVGGTNYNSTFSTTPSVNITKFTSFGFTPPYTSGTFQDVVPLSFTSDGSPTRLGVKWDVANRSGAYRQVELRVMVDGVPVGQTVRVGLQPNVYVPITLEAFATGLSAGSHNAVLQVLTDTASFDGVNFHFAAEAYSAIPVPVQDDSGRTVLTNSESLSVLTVAREITVPNTGAQDFIRTVELVTNPTGSSISTTMRIIGNVGSDAATNVFATSDGDNIVEPTDWWFGTDDGDGTGTPAIIHLLHGPFGLAPTSVAVTEDNVDWTYSLTVAPGETKRLASFTILGTTRADAIASVNALVNASGFTGQEGGFSDGR